ncbi:MAG: FkbM family methyltransferase [Candidatus Micrarchaeota archaeon]|nr:FkbM family methyltransferase [Candidatus Micrarchaeota archaeon]
MSIKDVLSMALQRLIPSYKRNLEKAVALHGIIIEQRFAWLVKGLKDITVIDIGAFIGDTAIYFASFDNVRRVYAYEPYPSAYGQAKRNIAISGLSEKISLSRTGIGAEDETIRIKGKGDIGSEFKDAKDGKMSSSLSINTILKGKTNVVIKSNSEGSEHKIFNSGANLKNVRRIHIAYHYGTGALPQILKSKGFKIEVRPEGRDPQKGDVGTIYAWKK